MILLVDHGVIGSCGSNCNTGECNIMGLFRALELASFAGLDRERANCRIRLTFR
jgi:hypothetical protein